MLERALRPNPVDQHLTAWISQKAYNAREGIETAAELRSAMQQTLVRKHTMLERALRRLYYH